MKTNYFFQYQAAKRQPYVKRGSYRDFRGVKLSKTYLWKHLKIKIIKKGLKKKKLFRPIKWVMKLRFFSWYWHKNLFWQNIVNKFFWLKKVKKINSSKWKLKLKHIRTFKFKAHLILIGCLLNKIKVRKLKKKKRRTEFRYKKIKLRLRQGLKFIKLQQLKPLKIKYKIAQFKKLYKSKLRKYSQLLNFIRLKRKKLTRIRGEKFLLTVKKIKAARAIKRVKNMHEINNEFKVRRLKRFFLNKKSLNKLISAYKWIFRYGTYQDLWYIINKGRKKLVKKRFKKHKSYDPKWMRVSMVRYWTWGPKERKRWKSHRFVKDFFKRKIFYARLRKVYLYKIMFKKFLREDFWFNSQVGWTYQEFLNNFQRLLVKYLINLPFVGNIFRSRALVRNKLVTVNGKGPKLVLNNYDLVSFIRTEIMRQKVAYTRHYKLPRLYSRKKRRKPRRVKKKLRYWIRFKRPFYMGRDIIYHKKKNYFIVLPWLIPTRSSYQKRTEKGYFSTFAYRLLTINRY